MSGKNHKISVSKISCIAAVQRELQRDATIALHLSVAHHDDGKTEKHHGRTLATDAPDARGAIMKRMQLDDMCN